MNRRAFLAGAAATSAAAKFADAMRPAAAESGLQPAVLFRGVNLAGAEFGETFPGLHGRDYVYPDVSHIERYARLGFNLIRLPFRWERLQPDLFAVFDLHEWARLAAAIEGARRHDMHIILDVHNYAGRHIREDGFTRRHLLGSPALPGEAFAQFWEDLASRTRSVPNVIFGLMNEPADIEVGDWVNTATLAIAAIRAAGAKNLILVPGVAYSGAHSWYSARNTLLERIPDPEDNFAFEVHQYFDGNSSGTQPRAVSSTIGSERLEAFQEWARARKVRAFLGEFGAGNDPTSLRALHDLLIEINHNKDVWLGWSAWAAGPWWPADYPLRLDPDGNGRFPAATKLLAQFAENRDLEGAQDSAIDLGPGAKSDAWRGGHRRGVHNPAKRGSAGTPSRWILAIVQS